ncbi:helix-turn-helix domain-containing protein [Clostridium septicum]|uniref:helix-turn-helix domain-containing protein n=1 Tax=Clostridium septicum TaxID=1504 RepID=UPI000830A264|nr:helix-turn-helix domain-containing protein [Clostridium septicum]
MTNNEKERIKVLREKGYSYSKIAVDLEISENTVKAFCRRNNLGGVRVGSVNTKIEEHIKCKQCEKELEQSEKGKRKKFCSDKCRRQWWKEHDYCIDRKAYYTLTCSECGNKFKSYGNKNRKYCSHNCYIKKRFGKGDRENE